MADRRQRKTLCPEILHGSMQVSPCFRGESIERSRFVVSARFTRVRRLHGEWYADLDRQHEDRNQCNGDRYRPLTAHRRNLVQHALPEEGGTDSVRRRQTGVSLTKFWTSLARVTPPGVLDVAGGKGELCRILMARCRNHFF